MNPIFQKCSRASVQIGTLVASHCPSGTLTGTRVKRIWVEDFPKPRRYSNANEVRAGHWRRHYSTVLYRTSFSRKKWLMTEWLGSPHFLNCDRDGLSEVLREIVNELVLVAIRPVHRDKEQQHVSLFLSSLFPLSIWLFIMDTYIYRSIS